MRRGFVIGLQCSYLNHKKKPECVSHTQLKGAPPEVPGGPPSSSSCGGQMRMNLLLGALFAAICVFGGVTEGGIQS